MIRTPSEIARHTSAVCRAEAEDRRQSPLAHQRAFADELDRWADNFARRAVEHEALEQPDLFGFAA